MKEEAGVKAEDSAMDVNVLEMKAERDEVSFIYMYIIKCYKM